jgi:hypothetical protein
MIAMPSNSTTQTGTPWRLMITRLILLWLTGLTAIAILYLLFTDAWTPTHQETMAQTQIYAYRGWQSTGVRLEAGEEASIRAEGLWLYTPGEWHGANGHSRYPAPSWYPITNAPGGVLVGRVGESGDPQQLGDYGRVYAWEGGMLYLRINDDILSDNQGSLFISIEVIPVPEPYAD